MIRMLAQPIPSRSWRASRNRSRLRTALFTSDSGCSVRPAGVDHCFRPVFLTPLTHAW